MKNQLILPQPGVHRLYIPGICLLFISACSVFKEKSFYESDSLAKARTAIRLQGESVSNSLRIYDSRDSAERQTSAEIFPKGTFQYSPGTGFSGEAERVIISERLKSGKKLLAAEQKRVEGKLKAVVSQSEYQKSRSRLKEKVIQTRYPFLWYAAGMVIIFLCIFWSRKYLEEAAGR